MLPSLTKYRHDTNGNFAIVSAVIMSLIILGTSVAVTLSQMVSVRQSIQNAADAASLAAIIEPESAFLTIQDREDIAKSHYLTNMEGSAGDLFDPAVSVTEDNGVFTSQVSGRAKIHHFLGVLMPKEFSFVEASAKALSVNQDAKHVNLFFMVDNSASMGIGQTSADQMEMLNDDNVFANTGAGACAVACHQPGSDTFTYYKDQGVRLRIDAVRDALLGFLNEISAHPAETENTRVSVALGSQRYNSNVHSLEPNIPSAINAANAFSLGDGSGRDNTNRNSPEVYVILMTDGIDNFWYQSAASGEHDPGAILSDNRLDDPAEVNMILQTMDATTCTVLKNRGVNIIVMNVEYVVPEFQRWGDDILHFTDIPDPIEIERIEAVIELVEDVEPPMQACASSPEFYFNVLSETSMREAFDSIFTKIFTSEPRIIN